MWYKLGIWCFKVFMIERFYVGINIINYIIIFIIVKCWWLIKFKLFGCYKFSIVVDEMLI